MVSTGSTRVPADPRSSGSGGAPPGWISSRPVRLLLAVGVIAVLALGLLQVEVPYFAISPGTAVPVGPLVSAPDDREVPTGGQIYLVTVRLGRVTGAGALRGWLDPAVEVVAQDQIVPPGVMTEELRAFNLAQMDTSKQQAVAVAFEKLGYDAVTGSGAEVVQVVAGSPADGALTAGEVVVGLDGMSVTAHHDVVEALRRRRPGGGLDLLVESSGGARRPVTLTLVAGPGDPGSALLGATLRTRSPRFDFPFEVDIASDRIGGPSAGLAFTLEILDALTDGELTGARRVAATGTIELDGSVGVVGGLAQKTAAATAAGMELFLVPAAEAEEARRLAGDRLTVEAVGSLDDALRVLVERGGDPLSPST